MRKFRLSTLRWLVLLLFLALFGAIVLRWISLERLRLSLLRLAPAELPMPTPAATPELLPTPSRPPVIGGKLDTAKLWSGITVRAEVNPTPGGAASVERSDPQSYVLDLKLNVRVPTPNRTIEELAQITPELPKLLPNLAATIKPDAVSPLFQELYETKVRTLRENLVRLDQLLSRHNFYDCQTILNLRHPETKRKAVLVQAEMDVDADGSDSDRLPTANGAPLNFKPFTSYRWKKKTTTPNVFRAPAEDKLKRYEAEFAQKGLTMDRNRELRLGIQRTRAEVDSLERFSFLIAATDPYIVLPGIFAQAKDAGNVGDYAVVVFGNQIYPTIVGDVGPNDKVGEASLRVAKEVNALTTPYSRPVSDLKVTYLIFPDTADLPFGPPDLERIYARCEKLVKEIGGASVPLHHWQNLIPPSPSPTPSPTPVSSPSPSPGISPSAVATSSIEPSPTFAFPTPTPSPTESPSVSPSSSSLPTASASLIPTTSPLVSPAGTP